MKCNLVIWTLLHVSFVIRTSAGQCTPKVSQTPKLNLCSYRMSHVKDVSEIRIPATCQVLDLSLNEITDVKDFAFVNLTRLLYLDLSRNRIETLHLKAFAGLRQLQCLDLRSNKLKPNYEVYPRQLFLPLQNLRVLDVGGNIVDLDILQYPDVTFQDLQSLEELNMDLLNSVPLGPGFTHLHALKKLSTSHCTYVKTLSKDMFVSFENITLTSLQITSCSVYHLDELTFKPLRFLEEINLSDNRMGLTAAMNSLSVLKGGNLSVIDFARVNSGSPKLQDQMVTADMFKHVKDFCITYLNLDDNKIFRFDMNVLLQLRHRECLQVIKLNRLFLPKESVEYMMYTLPVFRNLRVVEIVDSVFPKRIFKRSTASSFETSRTVTVFVPPMLQCLNISGFPITCRHRNWKFILNGGISLHTVIVSYSGGTNCFNRRVILKFPNLRYLDISGNSYSEDLSSEFFAAFPNLTHLVARDTTLTKVFRNEEPVFRELKHLQHVDIRNSGLTFLPKNLLINQPYLKKLDVGYNKLTSIPDLVFSLKTLKDLDLRYNAIKHISERHRNALDNFVRRNGELNIWLEGNPMICNCDTYDFVEWIMTSPVTFDKKGNYSCTLDSGESVPLVSLKSEIPDMKMGCVSFFWLKFGSVGLSSLLFISFASVIVYRYRVPIKYWYHAIRGKSADQAPGRFRYDALVAYCHGDRDWVLDHLYPALVDPESGSGYKLCVYDRNFLPGVPIEDSIMAAINRSYKIIMVITPAFVRSAWCKYELQLARIKMLREGREDVIIPVILEDVPVTSMPRSLLNLWNTSVFLIWSESPGEQRHFWANLTAALGPVRVADHEGGQDGGNLVVMRGDREQTDGDGDCTVNEDDDDRILI